MSETNKSQTLLSEAETSVLASFDKFLMTPGQMLCFNSAELDSLKKPLDSLIEKGLLVSERFRGGYSLTESGFAAMKDEG